MDRALLPQFGIDYDRGVHVCMDDPAFYRILLGMFLQDGCFLRAREAFLAGDDRALFGCAHELKGVSGNTALMGLHEALAALVELLRAGDCPRQAVAEGFAAVETAYELACRGIRQYLAQP